MRDRLVIVDIATRRFKSVSFKQYDRNNLLQIVLYENKKIVDVSNYVAIAYFEMPSGNVIKINTSIQNNTINVLLSESVLKEYGQVKTEIELLNEDQIVTTFAFYLNVEKSINKVSSLTDTEHMHLNKDVLDQITQEMIDSILLGGGMVDLSSYQTRRDINLNTTDKTVVGAINELNDKIENNGNVDLSEYARKEEVPTKTSQLINDSGFAVQPNFVFKIKMIESGIDPSVTTEGTYPNLIITFNIPKCTSVPIEETGYMYYGRLSINEVGGQIIPYSQLTANMIINGVSITKASIRTSERISMGLMSTTKKYDYVVVAVPANQGYVVTQDEGIGGKTVWHTDVAGCNGEVIINIDNVDYAIFGEILLSQAEKFIYVDKN